MDPDQTAAVASNLSYVLHERSDSPIVANYVATLERERSKLARRIRRLTSLGDKELAGRLIINDERRRHPPVDGESWKVFSVNVGVWNLLPRVLRLAGLVPDEVNLNCTFVDGQGCPEQERRPLFRGMALLCAPVNPSSTSERLAFASAILRPGGDSVLVRFCPFDPVVTDVDHIWAVVAGHAEATIREFVEQWQCQRSLWRHPAELTLPEFTREANGTTACGR